jgi:hypothetical protein
MTTNKQTRPSTLRIQGPAPGRVAAPATDKVVFQNGVWVIRDTVSGRAYGPFGLRRLADEELAKGRIPDAAPRVAHRVR